MKLKQKLTALFIGIACVAGTIGFSFFNESEFNNSKAAGDNDIYRVYFETKKNGYDDAWNKRDPQIYTGATTWPGDTMHYVSETDDHKLWYYDIPNNSSLIVFTCTKENGDRDQTTNITTNIKPGSAWYLNGGSWGSRNVGNYSNNYTINLTLDKNGGTTDGSAKYGYGNAILTVALTDLSHATRNGYNLDGYYTSASGGSKVINSDGSINANVTDYTNAKYWINTQADVTLYAHWNAASYTITYKDRGGSDYSGSNLTSLPSSYTYGVGVELLNGTKSGYTFDGWYDASTGGNLVTEIGTAECGNKTLYAQWVPDVPEYTVTLAASPNGYGTVSPASLTVQEGTTITSSGNKLYINDVEVAVATPTTATSQYSYSFSSWSGIPSSITGDVTITANFVRTGVGYTLTYNTESSDKGTVSSTTTSGSTVNYGTSVTLTASPNDGYSFDGWYESTTKVSSSASYIFNMPAKNYTLVAKFTGNEYTITYKDRGGADYSGNNSASLPGKYTTGTGVELVNGTKSGYTFDGWYDESTGGNLVTEIGTEEYGNKTLYAQWVSAGTIDIYFTNNKSWSEIYYYGTDIYDTKIFGDWPGTAFPSRTYTNSSNQGVYKITVPADIDILVFSGKSGENSVQTVDATSFTNNCGFYVKDETDSEGHYKLGDWTYTETTVSFNTHGGTAVADKTLITNQLASEVTKATVPTKDDYVFNGFYDKETGGTQYFDSTGALVTTWTSTDSTATLHAQWTQNDHYTIKVGETSYTLIENPKKAGEYMTENPVSVSAGDVLAVYNNGTLQTMTAKQIGNNNCYNNSGVTTVVCDVTATLFVDTTNSTIFASGFDFGTYYLKVENESTSKLDYIKLTYNTTPTDPTNYTEYFTPSAYTFVDGDIISFVNTLGEKNSITLKDIAVVDSHSLSSDFVTSGTKIACDTESTNVKSMVYLKLAKNGSVVDSVYFGNVDLQIAVDFAKAFNAAIGGDDGVCDPQGHTDLDALSGAWATQAAAFALIEDESAISILKKTTASSPYSDLKAFAKLYDYVYSKYKVTPGLADFASRFADGGGGVESGSPIMNPYYGNNTENMVVTIVIVSASLLALSSLATVLILKKKKKEK